MGLNVGAIFVEAKGQMNASRVAEETRRYWKLKGAAPDGQAPLDLNPLAVSEGKAYRLGVAVAPAAQGWIGVRDSERYTADHSLATHFSKALATRVCWFKISSATDDAILQIVDKGKPTDTVQGEEKVFAFIERLKIPDATLYFHDLRKKKKLTGWSLLSLAPVSRTKYDYGPEPADGDEDDDGPPPPKNLAAFYAKIDKGLLLSDDDWERVETLDAKLAPEICRLGRRALKGKEARSWVLTHLASRAIQAGDTALFKDVLERAPSTKKDPINQSNLMEKLGLWLSHRIHKGSIPGDWRTSVEAWIQAALPFASRSPAVHVGAAEAYARLREDEKAREQVRLAIRHGAFYGHGLDQDPVVAPLLKRPPFDAEVAKLLQQTR